MTEQKRKTAHEVDDLKTQINSNTRIENLQARHEIPSYKLKIMLKQAEKIYSQLMDIPQFASTYDDVEFILEIVLDAVQNARRKNDVLV